MASVNLEDAVAPYQIDMGSSKPSDQTIKVVVYDPNTFPNRSQSVTISIEILPRYIISNKIYSCMSGYQTPWITQMRYE